LENKNKKKKEKKNTLQNNNLPTRLPQYLTCMRLASQKKSLHVPYIFIYLENVLRCLYNDLII
jgi:hypothetical protein